MDQATCAYMIAGLKANASKLTSTDRAALASVTPADCEWVMTGTQDANVISSSTFARSNPFSPLRTEPTEGIDLAASGCRRFDRSVQGNVGFLTVLTMRVNVSLCWNGTTVWRDWGPDCSFKQIVPLYALGITWCGVYHSGWPTAEPGMNGSVAPITVPVWVWAHPYMRFKVDANGVLMEQWWSWT